MDDTTTKTSLINKGIEAEEEDKAAEEEQANTEIIINKTRVLIKISNNTPNSNK